MKTFLIAFALTVLVCFVPACALQLEPRDECVDQKSVIVPYPGDDSKFVACTGNGKGLVRDCPPGFKYSADKHNCYNPETEPVDPAPVEPAQA